MHPVPAQPKIFHITHLDNLSEIVRAGVLWSDAKRLALALGTTVVGMSSIKERRLQDLWVRCHPGTRVGEYVPFYFCPRSVMLYILHMRNSPELAFRGGQEPIVHLMADLNATVAWADANQMAKDQRVPRMTAGRAALVGLMRRYLAAVMDPTVTLLEIHKSA